MKVLKITYMRREEPHVQDIRYQPRHPEEGYAVLEGEPGTNLMFAWVVWMCDPELNKLPVNLADTSIDILCQDHSRIPERYAKALGIS